MNEAPNPLAPRLMSNSALIVLASMRELPVVSMPPADAVALVVLISASSTLGASLPVLGASTRALASGGGAPVGAPGAGAAWAHAEGANAITAVATGATSGQ